MTTKSYADEIEELLSSFWEVQYRQGGRVWRFKMMDAATQLDFEVAADEIRKELEEATEKDADAANSVTDEVKGFAIYYALFLNSLVPQEDREAYEAEMKSLPNKYRMRSVIDWYEESKAESGEETPSDSL